MFKYFKCKWNHHNLKDPITLYSELNDSRMEIRKVEVWANGSIGYANNNENTPGTELGTEAIPPLSDISKDPQFQPIEITKEEFEIIWLNRKSSK